MTTNNSPGAVIRQDGAAMRTVLRFLLIPYCLSVSALRALLTANSIRKMPTTQTFDALLRRYGGATREMLDRVLRPYRLPITSIDRNHSNGKAPFTAAVPDDVWTTFEEGTTGKVVPKGYVEGNEAWREKIKGRILKAGSSEVEGELYFAPARFVKALAEVQVGDYLELDPFGVSSKIESALCEASFFRQAEAMGFAVTRMPENVAKHVGTQNYYDFKLARGGKVYRVELKSLWGTDTTKARLIHTVSKDGGGKNSARTDRQVWTTSSCRFQDQDIFAVSMWLRTGRIDEFAYALSAPADEAPRMGLPRVPDHPNHVTQNPNVPDPPSGPWTEDLNEVCERVDKWRKKRTKT